MPLDVLNTPPTDRQAPLRPGPWSSRSKAEQRDWLRRLFDETAADYDRVEGWLSLGTGRRHRRQTLFRAGVRPGMSVADVATGTGLVAREAVGLVGAGGRVVGIDPSQGMLARASASLGIPTVRAWADDLPFPDASFDFVTMGYALRHMDDLGSAFREFARVLRPGGRVCILEISRPGSAAARWALRGYLRTIARAARGIARLAKVSPRTGELWDYYWDTIDRCIPPDRIVHALRGAGFGDAAHDRQFGVFSTFVGTKDAPEGELPPRPR